MSHHLDGAYLKRQIRQAGYTLEEFCEELGVGKSTFYYYRSGARSIPHKLRKRIEELLVCSFDEFMVPDQEPNLRVLPSEQQRRSGQQP